MSDKKEIVTSIIIIPQNEPIFSEHAYSVKIEDESAGAFIVVEANLGSPDMFGKISFNIEDWPFIKKAIQKMVKAAIKYNKDSGYE